jgi:hypothetical protein
MGLVIGAQAFQNLNRFFERWRFDLHCLESAFERCIFFDVLAVLIGHISYASCEFKSIMGIMTEITTTTIVITTKANPTGTTTVF